MLGKKIAGEGVDGFANGFNIVDWDGTWMGVKVIDLTVGLMLLLEEIKEGALFDFPMVGKEVVATGAVVDVIIDEIFTFGCNEGTIFDDGTVPENDGLEVLFVEGGDVKGPMLLVDVED